MPLNHHTFHAVQFYHNDDLLVGSVSRFVTDALQRNGTVIAIATKDHCDRLQTARARGLPGALITADAADVLAELLVNGNPDRARFRRAFHHLLRQVDTSRPVFVFGEMVAMLCAQGRDDAAIALERLGNELFAQSGVSILCAYPASLQPEERHMRLLLDVCRMHTHLGRPTISFPCRRSTKTRNQHGLSWIDPTVRSCSSPASGHIGRVNMAAQHSGRCVWERIVDSDIGMGG